MVDSDNLYGSMDVGDDLSTALGTETLADRDMVPADYSNNAMATQSSEALAIKTFEGRRFLKVDLSVGS
jgi:hypothetical protein